MSDQHISELTARLTSDSELRQKVVDSPSEEHRSILSAAGVDHHEQLDDEQLAAVVGGIGDVQLQQEELRQALDTGPDEFGGIGTV